MLGMAYHLRPVELGLPLQGTPLATWLGSLSDGSVLSTDIPCSAELENVATALGVQLVAILRHPFDLFVSMYDVAQQRAARERSDGEDTPWGVMANQDIGNPAVQAYAAGAFQREIEWLSDWQTSGCATVRFELLEADPAAALAAIADRISPLSPAEIAHAVALCPADNPVASRPGRGRRMPPLRSGAWRERLPDSVLAILRERYALHVERLGYDLA